MINMLILIPVNMLTVDLPIVNSLVVDLSTADLKSGFSPVFY